MYCIKQCYEVYHTSSHFSVLEVQSPLVLRPNNVLALDEISR
jgi:hypothetical protein